MGQPPIPVFINGALIGAIHPASVNQPLFSGTFTLTETVEAYRALVADKLALLQAHAMPERERAYERLWSKGLELRRAHHGKSEPGTT